MKCRHAQWLIVIKNTANIERELTYAAATQELKSNLVYGDLRREVEGGGGFS